jgi:putative transposase
MPHPPLEHENYYHIYNHAVGGRKLFKESENYRYFLHLYNKYIGDIADVFAWVLMPNHFHFLVRLKPEPPHLTGLKDLSGVAKPHQCFSNFFNAYTKAFNKRYGCRGAMFERPFRRKLIDSEFYLKQLILYIHNNPVHHGFLAKPEDYEWSSYSEILSNSPAFVMRETVVDLFDDIHNFKAVHKLFANSILDERFALE